jgi:hypothetical protein
MNRKQRFLETPFLRRRMAAQLNEQETTFPGNSFFTPPNGGAVISNRKRRFLETPFLRRRMAAQLIEQETTFPGNSFFTPPNGGAVN